MTAVHRLDLADEGSFSGARLMCLATEDDLCRQWCAEGCEEGCWHTPIQADTELVAQAPIDGHRWAPHGSCRVADWIEACGIQDSHTDPDGFPFDDDGLTQVGVRSGYVDVEWTGDDYVWSYLDLPATGVLVAPAPTDDAPTLFEVSM